MAEFVVGQWVERCVELVKVWDTRTEAGLVGVEVDGERRWTQEENVKPFIWQVGRTYKTTLEGVTAKIKSLSSSSVSADMSDKPGTVCFNLRTGKLLGMESREDQPHLLPFLADEPSEPKPASTEQQKLDTINPQHYRDHPSGIECIQVTEHMGYCIGNAIKYLWRAGKKGPAIEDLKKAAWYINREIERLAKGGA